MELENLSDEQLWDIINESRDPRAFEIIYNRYHNFLYTIALGYTKSHESALDIVQEVLIKFYTSKQETKMTGIKSYLRDDIASRCNYYLRKARKIPRKKSVHILVDDECDVIVIRPDKKSEAIAKAIREEIAETDFTALKESFSERIKKFKRAFGLSIPLKK